MKTIDPRTRELLKTWIIRFGGGCLVPSYEDAEPSELSATIDRLNSRKLRKIGISFELWSMMIRGELFPSSRSTAPADLTVVGMIPSGSPRLDLDVLIWSESFSPIPEGETEVPEISVTLSVEYQVIRRRS